MNSEEIRTEIANIRYYGVQNLRALAGLANEIMQSKTERKELTKLFEAQHGRKVSVWSRVEKWFGDEIAEVKTTDAILAISYMCQLPKDKCLELFESHKGHLDEPMVHLLVLKDVNELRPTRKPKEKCARCVKLENIVRRLVDSHTNNIEDTEAFDMARLFIQDGKNV